MAACLFPALSAADAPQVPAPSSYAADLSFRPSEGVWWSSEQPGTGVAFNMDGLGRWFAAIYLYEADGSPTFLTMQGEALAYEALHPSQDSAWAVAASPLVHSEGGQCLGCPWRPANADFGDMDAQIRFYGRNSAELWVGDWSLRLTPLMVPDRSYEAIMPPFDRHYVFTGRTEPGGALHVATVWLQSGLTWTGYSNARMVCVDCRTVGPDGGPDAEADAELEAALEAMEIFCGPASCNLSLDEEHEHATVLFVDKNRRLYSALDTRPASEDQQVNVIKLQLLDEGWRPPPPGLPWFR